MIADREGEDDNQRALSGENDTHLDGIEWPTSGLWVELHTPDSFTALRSGDDTLHGRVVAVDEEWCPAVWESFGELEGVLVILGLDVSGVSPRTISGHAAREEEEEERQSRRAAMRD